MQEEQDKKEEQEQNPEEAPESNGAATPPELEAIKAELEEERKARADTETQRQELETKLASAQGRIAELEKALNDATHARDAATTELTTLKDAHSKAVAKYLDAVKLANPTIPGDVIAGNTIEEIDAAVKKALAIADSVKKSLEAQAKEAKVPAGAPPRGNIPLESLSPREKIALGITSLRGTQ